MRDNTVNVFLALVRLGIGHSAYTQVESVDWYALKALAEEHGLSAVVLDGIDRLTLDGSRFTDEQPLEMKLDWIGEVLGDYEQRYEQYKRAIANLAGWHIVHGFKMMVLKGYACSLDWPKPEHRPCGDIDIWQFGQQKEADAALTAWFKSSSDSEVQEFEIDNSHHHHTVFEWEGFTVENHYDFLNVHHHKSNVEIEAILKELGGENNLNDNNNHDSETNTDGTNITNVIVNGEKVYLPSPNLHALFLLRHSMSNFASTGLELRQLLDWGFFVEKHGEKVDWTWLQDVTTRYGMKPLFDIFNAICVEDLGFDASIFPTLQFLPALKERVLNDILSREFSEKEEGGFIRRAIFKYRRWKANAWKHELCFNDSLSSAFWSGVKSHLLKPSSI